MRMLDLFCDESAAPVVDVLPDAPYGHESAGNDATPTRYPENASKGQGTGRLTYDAYFRSQCAEYGPGCDTCPACVPFDFDARTRTLTLSPVYCRRYGPPPWTLQ